MIYEDLPSNLSAIRDYVEKREGSTSSEASDRDNIKYSDEQISSMSNNGDSSYYKENLDEKDYSFDISTSPHRQRPKVPGLHSDIEVLKAELLNFISKHGQEGFMPMRKQLRLHGRVDIEKAVTRMGGFRRIASLMNLSLAYKHRKPKGYWDNLENLQEEVSFQHNRGA